MKTEERTSTIYIAADGKEFLTEAECLDYEQNELARINSLKFFCVTHSPDLTEGRGFGGMTYIAIESGYFAEEWARDWCLWKFGRHIAFVQGVAETPNWILRNCTAEDYRKCIGGQLGDYKHKAKQVFLSRGEALQGFPEPSDYRVNISIRTL